MDQLKIDIFHLALMNKWKRWEFHHFLKSESRSSNRVVYWHTVKSLTWRHSNLLLISLKESNRINYKTLTKAILTLVLIVNYQLWATELIIQFKIILRKMSVRIIYMINNVWEASKRWSLAKLEVISLPRPSEAGPGTWLKAPARATG